MQTIESIVSFFVSPQKLVERIVVVVVGAGAVVAMPRPSLFSASFRTNSILCEGILDLLSVFANGESFASTKLFRLFAFSS